MKFMNVRKRNVLNTINPFYKRVLKNSLIISKLKTVKKLSLEDFLEPQKLSALENQTLRGGMSLAPSKCKKDRDFETKGVQTRKQ